MQSNVLNDLAEAKRRWTEKNAMVAKIQQDLITTTSRAPNVARVGLTPRRAFNKFKTQKHDGCHCQTLGSFSTQETQRKQAVCPAKLSCTCNMHSLVFSCFSCSVLLKWQRRHAKRINVLLKLLTTMLGEFNLFEFHHHIPKINVLHSHLVDKFQKNVKIISKHSHSFQK